MGDILTKKRLCKDCRHRPKCTKNNVWMYGRHELCFSPTEEAKQTTARIYKILGISYDAYYVPVGETTTDGKDATIGLMWKQVDGKWECREFAIYRDALKDKTIYEAVGEAQLNAYDYITGEIRKAIEALH